MLRVGDENSMLAAERRDRESAEFGEMKREAGGLGEFLLCPQGKANKKKLTGWPQAAAGHRNPALGLSPPYTTPDFADLSPNPISTTVTPQR